MNRNIKINKFQQRERKEKQQFRQRNDKGKFLVKHGRSVGISIIHKTFHTVFLLFAVNCKTYDRAVGFVTLRTMQFSLYIIYKEKVKFYQVLKAVKATFKPFSCFYLSFWKFIRSFQNIYLCNKFQHSCYSDHTEYQHLLASYFLL